MTLVGLNQDLNRVVPKDRAGVPLQRPDRHGLSRQRPRGRSAGRIAQRHDRLDSADARRRRRRAGRRAGLRLVALAPADDGSVPAGGAAIPERSRTWVDLSPPLGLANGPAALAAIQAHGLMLLGVGVDRHVDALDCRHAVCPSRPAHEPGHRLWRSRRRNDRRCRRDRRLRGRGKSDAGPWRRRAVCHRQRRLDGAWTDHRRSDVCRLTR